MMNIWKVFHAVAQIVSLGYPWVPISSHLIAKLRSENGHGTPESLPSQKSRRKKTFRNFRSAFITNSGTKKSSEIGSKSPVIMRMSNIWYVLIIYIYIISIHIIYHIYIYILYISHSMSSNPIYIYSFCLRISIPQRLAGARPLPHNSTSEKKGLGQLPRIGILWYKVRPPFDS